MRFFVLFCIGISLAYSSPTHFQTPKEALDDAGMYTEASKRSGDVIVSLLYTGEPNDIVAQEAKRNIVLGFLLSFIHTKKKKITMTNKLRKFPLSVAKQLLKIRSLDELLGAAIKMGDNVVMMDDTPNKLFETILYNDRGGVTLDVFWSELSKYVTSPL